MSHMTSRSVPGTDLYLPPDISSSSNQNSQSPYRTPQYRARHAVSPVISNYFGLPPERDSTKSSSIVSEPLNNSNNDNGDDLDFWGGSRLRYKYGFLSNETESTDEQTEVDEDDYDEDAVEDSEEEEEEEEEDDDADSIEIFGHR